MIYRYALISKNEGRKPSPSLLPYHLLHNPLAFRQEETSNGAHEEKAYQGADPYRASEEESAEKEEAVNNHPHDRESLVGFVADYNAYKVVWTCARIGFYHYRHTESKYQTAQGIANQTDKHCALIVDYRIENHREEIDYRTSEKHTNHGSNLYVTSVNKKQHNYNQDAYRNMCVSVSYPTIPEQRLRLFAEALNHHIEGIRSKVSQQKQRNTKVGNYQSHYQNQNSYKSLFHKHLHRFRLYF